MLDLVGKPEDRLSHDVAQMIFESFHENTYACNFQPTMTYQMCTALKLTKELSATTKVLIRLL